ncbi:MAG: T9SS type A sorting domain-containing protein [Bacteroidetes bacterium]|nr:T9SS type A sorting domain-containing protein [Bacteroidota bacterium]
MKTKLLTKVGLAALFLGGTLQAQIQFYYHFNPGTYDRGRGNEIIQTTSTTAPIGMVVAGAAFSAGNVPSAFIAKYTNAGATVFHRFYSLNAAPAGSVCEAVSIVESPNTATPGFGMLCYTSAAPAQTVLIKTDVNGTFLWKREIGPLRGASVAYDATLQRFLCLTQIFTQGTNQIQLVVVNANTGAIVFNRYFDGCQGDDTPVTVIHDTSINEYVCLGNSRNLASGDSQIMLVRVTTGGIITYIRAFGDPMRREFATDLLRNPAVADYTIGGYIGGAPNTPFFASITVAGAAPVITPCNGLPGDNIPRRMALIGGNYLMVGRQTDAVGNVNGFVVGVTSAFAPLGYRIYGQPPAAGSEELVDISLGSVAATPTIMCGTHQRTVAWLGSAAGASYNWVVTANPAGAGTCPQNFGFVNFSYVPALVNCTFFEASIAPTLVAQANISQTATALNECTNPNRLAAVEDNAQVALLYPNPANQQLITEIVLGENETAELVLLDMTGRVVKTETLGNQSGRIGTQVGDLPEGIYLCIIQTATRKLLEQKVVITH